MRSVRHEVPGAARERHLVLLSGGFIRAEEFVREGFIEGLRSRGIDCPVTIGEVRMAYFADGSVTARVQELVEAAHAEGATRTWIAGISLGGLAALCQAARAGAGIDGLALLSPYPGTRLVLREIDEAGGLAAWAAARPPADLEREAWHWLARRAPGQPPVHAWYGSGDRFVEGQRRLAAALPGENVNEIAGGHDWADWRGMWKRFLDTDSLR